MQQIMHKIGKKIAAKVPNFKLLFAADETIPTRVGPALQPTSPARANNANINVPPFLIPAADILNVPGHIIPTEKPQIAQPIKLSIGHGDNEIIR